MSKPNELITGLYIHIPYCRKACHYCNFHFSTSMATREEFLQALLCEIDLTRGKEDRLIQTIYLGGGTPSLLFRSELRTIMHQIHKKFNVMEGLECTLEANPDDLTFKKAGFWKMLGINRVSLGVQSFRDQDLVWMNRSHTADQSHKAIRFLQHNGMHNLSIDLIYGIPGLHDDAWRQNIITALQYDIPHISAYALTVEPKTALQYWIGKGKMPDVDPEQQTRQFDILMDMLDGAGYTHYEISNFAKPGFQSRHNSAYWKGIPYFGFGPGAHAFDGKSRYWNTSNNQRYIDAIRTKQIPSEKETLTEKQRLNEYIMTSLRTQEGIDLNDVQSNWGKDIANQLAKQAEPKSQQGFICLQDQRIQLTRKGKHFADGIAADLFFV